MTDREENALGRFKAALEGALGKFEGPYLIPAAWTGAPGGVVKVDPAGWVLESLEKILGSREEPPSPEPGWTRKAAAYNLFVRLGAAWDHDGDGVTGAEPLEGGWRETGTLVKALGLLPYIRSLGCDTVHLLPVAAMGKCGRKGILGSPYSVRDPYRVEETLAEPALGLGPEACMEAFTAAAHRLGMRVVVEFVPRTAAPDSDWVAEHPEWFYWVDADLPDRPEGSEDPGLYGPPLFPPGTLEVIKRKVEVERNFRDLPPPPQAYRALFREPPAPETLEKVEGCWVGRDRAGRRVRVATAFADWPPDDNQPTWKDAAYLRLYDHPDFNYVAYNTVRMYDERLARPENRMADLWERIAGILPWWRERFGVDGVMVDMGHALPPDLKRNFLAAARKLDPAFAFWDENFAVSEESAREGFDAVLGYSWLDVWPREKLEGLLWRLSTERLPLPFFATAETHDSPRAAGRPGGEVLAPGLFALLSAMPAVPWVHGGFELGAKVPVNTGLDFTPEEIRQYPPERLPLFSPAVLPWERPGGLVSRVRKALAARRRFLETASDPDPEGFRFFKAAPAGVLGVFRRGKAGEFLVLFNPDPREGAPFEVEDPFGGGPCACLLSGKTLTPGGDGRLRGTLDPGEALWLAPGKDALERGGAR